MATPAVKEQVAMFRVEAPHVEQIVPFIAYVAMQTVQTVALLHVEQPVGQATHPVGAVQKNPVIIHEVQTVFKVELAHEAQPVTLDAQVA